jgi:hypothetical protein
MLNGIDVQGILINWFPMILIVGVWLFFILRMRRGPLTKYQKDCNELWLRQIESLERIATALEKKG